jgi:hypothetical protein
MITTSTWSTVPRRWWYDPTDTLSFRRTSSSDSATTCFSKASSA